MKTLIYLATLCIFSCLNAGLLPDYDKNCDFLNSYPCPIEDILEYQSHVHTPVPRSIHQIWFGDKNRLNRVINKEWRKYCSDMGYSYRLWTEEDQEEISQFMKHRNYELWKTFISIKNWWSASDILRLEIIHNLGGVYVDCDFSPPKYNGKFVDLFNLISSYDLTLVTENDGRNIGSKTALFAGNWFISAPLNHPVITHCVESICDNAMSFYNQRQCFDAMYSTGPFFLNRSLNGRLCIIPVPLFKSLGCID